MRNEAGHLRVLNPVEMKFLLFLAQRLRMARRVYRHMRALPNVPPLILGEAEGNVNEAWNSFQIAKTLPNPTWVDTRGMKEHAEFFHRKRHRARQ